MRVAGHFHQAFVNLIAAKLRSFLAALGILVGTAAVVALISCGELATAQALEEFKSLGTNLLALSLYPASHAKAVKNEPPISLELWHSLPEKFPTILEIAPYSTAYQSLSYQGVTVNGVIIGADDSLAHIINIQMAAGHFVSFVTAYERYCVIGNGLAQQLNQISFGNPIGKQLRIDQALYTIIGIASPWKENSFFNEDINQAVLIPVEGMALINKSNKINNAILLLQQDTSIDELISELKELFNDKLPTLTVYARSAKQIVASMESQGRIFTLLLAIIGSISLVVGGIGIMNVMLVSVSERKKEIGIRKAVGAKNAEIQALFLVEAILLSILGGGLGVLIGLILTYLIAYFSGWSFSIFLMPVFAGFIVSTMVGIFFGFYPARRAARLEPIICLRSE